MWVMAGVRIVRGGACYLVGFKFVEGKLIDFHGACVKLFINGLFKLLVQLLICIANNWPLLNWLTRLMHFPPIW